MKCPYSPSSLKKPTCVITVAMHGIYIYRELYSSHFSLKIHKGNYDGRGALLYNKLPYIPCIAAVITLSGVVREDGAGALLRSTIPYIPCIAVVITLVGLMREEESYFILSFPIYHAFPL